MSPVRIEKPSPYVSVIVLDRPKRMNSMAFDLMQALRDAFGEVGRDYETTG